MMKLSLYALTALLSLGLATACEKAKEVLPPPSAPQTETTKPDRVAVNRVAIVAFSELAHLERAMKPYFGLELSADRTANCRTTVTSRSAIWKTKWACDFREATSGRKEIEGDETVNFEAKKALLTYDSKFETRIFSDNEPRDQAHTLVSTRKMRIIFDRSLEKPTAARFTIVSRTFRKNATSVRRGSNWTMSLTGQIKLIDGAWSIEPGAKISSTGSVFGDDDERFTLWASGDFNFISKTETRMGGLSSASTCTKPDFGFWRVQSVGGGESFDTEIELSNAGVSESSGSALNWPYDICERP